MIYLDNAATTQLLPEVKREMIDYIESELFGNPSSIHHKGRKAKSVIENARDIIADSINADASEIVFTSSGSESINSAIIGAVLANHNRGKHIITSSIEHHAVLDTCKYLDKLGWEITYLPVNKQGKVEIDSLIASIRQDTVLVSIMYANNETGAIQPIEEIAKCLVDKNVIFHCDMVQAYGQIPINMQEVPIDLLSASAHKIHGPKGIGMLYIRKELNWHPYIHGGKQERGRRAGTENVLGIIGFAKAVDVSFNKLQSKREHISLLKNTFLDIIIKDLADDKWVLNSHLDGLPSILNISFPQINAETLLIQLDMLGIACSHGSACTSGSLESSHVLKAIGVDESILNTAIRFSFSQLNNIEEVTIAVSKIVEILSKQK
jgi:cysteine desulfurase